MLKKGMTKWMKKENLVVLILSGVLLFIIALPTNSGEKSAGDSLLSGRAATGNAGSGLTVGGNGSAATRAGTGTETGGNTETAGLGNGNLDETQNSEYAKALEQELTEILGEISGVGEVKVMITLKSSRELVVEKEENVNRSATNEKDAQGGSRIVNQMESEAVTVYRTQSGESEPYVVKTLTPEIEGILIVAQGAGSGEINRTLTDVVQALFGLEVHKIRVVKMGS